MAAERDKRQVRFFLYFGRYTPELFLDLRICRANSNKSTDNISKLASFPKMASKFLPGDAFFMAASKRLPYRSYYCCVLLPFGSVGIVLYNQRRVCREFDTIITEIIFGIQERARWRHYELLCDGVLRSTTLCSTWGRNSPGDPSYEVGDNYSSKSKTYNWLVSLHNPLFTESRDSWVGVCVVSEFDPYLLHVFVSKRAR